MTATEALKVALAKEENAIKLYKDMANKYPEIRDLLLSLLNEEEKHKQLISKKIQEITRY
jgi:rubrerythrin